MSNEERRGSSGSQGRRTTARRAYKTVDAGNLGRREIFLPGACPGPAPDYNTGGAQGEEVVLRKGFKGAEKISPTSMWKRRQPALEIPVELRSSAAKNLILMILREPLRYRFHLNRMGARASF